MESPFTLSIIKEQPDKNTGIYRILNITNNKCYVGSSISLHHRKNEHFRDLRKNVHHSVKLQRAYNKYGYDKFSFEVLENCTKEELKIKEEFWIKELKTYKFGYNWSRLTGSSFLGRKHSVETCLLISIRGKGTKRSAETKYRISQARKGVRHSVETRKKMSDGHKGLIPTKETVAKICLKTSIPIIVLNSQGEIRYFKSFSDCSKVILINQGDISRSVKRMTSYKGLLFIPYTGIKDMILLATKAA